MLRAALAKTPRIRPIKAEIKKIPEGPGVYVFLKGKESLYIGKAVSLRTRVISYFSAKVGPKTSRMLKEADGITYIKAISDLEALLLEAEMIRKEQPDYNTVSKDDKHPLYIKITDENYPRVTTARKSEAKKGAKAFFGPFPSAANVRKVLRLIRRIFPFSDHKVGKKPCLYSQIGLCDPCPSLIEATVNSDKDRLGKVYRKNIKRVKWVLSGRSKDVLASLYREMDKYSRIQLYEQAAGVKSKINALEYITQPVTRADSFIQNPNLSEDIRAQEEKNLRRSLAQYLKLKRSLKRIECFDVAHLAGTSPTASMVTFIKGEPEKSLYRRFKIKSTAKANDTASLREVAGRRLKALGTWGVPDLIVVDGGRDQAGVFEEVFSEKGIPVVGLAKRLETVIIPIPLGGKSDFAEIRLKGPGLYLVQRLRNEAHRFARRYHHLLVKKNLLS